MDMIESYVPTAQAPAQWPEIVRKIRNTGEPIALTENGAPEAVLLPFSAYAGLLETIDILADAKAMARLARAAEDEKHGRFLSMEEVFG